LICNQPSLVDSEIPFASNRRFTASRACKADMSFANSTGTSARQQEMNCTVLRRILLVLALANE
jgi:hypothetical protein